jgi:AcrB/AcrD/AcrF family
VGQDGVRSTLLSIFKNGSASTLSVAAGVKTAMANILKTVTTDVQVKQFADQSIFVKAAVSGVVREGVIAACLTALMLLLFLASWRATIIVAVSIPLSILTSLAILSALGETICIEYVKFAGLWMCGFSSQHKTDPVRVRRRFCRILIVGGAVVLIALVVGFLPQLRQRQIAAADTKQLAVPTVAVVSPVATTPGSGLNLPAEVRPIQDARLIVSDDFRQVLLAQSQFESPFANCIANGRNFFRIRLVFRLFSVQTHTTKEQRSFRHSLPSRA